MMRQHAKNSKLYEAFDIRLRELISESNSGRRMSDENKKQMSLRHLGKVNAKTNTGEILRVKVDDPRFVSGELVNARVGYTHTPLTKAKMSKNGIRGHSPVIINGKIKYKYTDDELRNAIVTEVWSADRRKMISDIMSNTKWIIDEGKSKRVAIDDPRDSLGRIFDNPWSKENMQGKKFVYCLKRKKKILVNDYETEPTWIKHAEKTTIVYVYDNIVGVGNDGMRFFQKRLGVKGCKDKTKSKEIILSGIDKAGVVWYNINEFTWIDGYTLWQN